MMWHLFLALGGPARAIAGLQPIGEPEWNDGVVCYTYLSTYLVPIAAETVEPNFPALPSFTRGIIPPYFSNRSTSVPPSAVTEASEINEKSATFIDFTSSDFAILTDDQEDPGTTATDSGSLFPPTSVTLTGASATNSKAASGQAVIFFVSPQIDNEERSVVKRAPGGFIGDDNTNVDICTNAGTFRLGDGQLFDLQDPIYYDSEPYKEFRGQGTPPADAVTRGFSNVAGALVFANRALPNTNAGFCQVEESGQVYITFTSSPPGCVPISLRVYAVEQCQNGQIIGLDPAQTATTEPTQPSTIAETMNNAPAETATFPEDISSTAPLSAQVSQSSELFPETTETTPSFNPEESSTSSPADQATTVTSDLSFEVSSPIPSFFTSSRSIETPPSFTTSIETSIPSESFTSLLSSFTTTASSDSFSSDRTLSSDLFSSSETFASEPTSTLTIESSTESEVTSELSSTVTEEPTTTTEALTTTTEEATTTTGCNSVDPLTTVALANPTPVFGNDYRDNEFASFQLPWSEGLFGTGQTTVYINTNGYITLDAGNTNPENSDLPTDSLVNRAFLPYWDDLVYDPSKGHAVVYEIFQSVYGPQLVVEFILGKADSPGVYHFEANFFKNYPEDFRFQYYTTPEKGSSATAGFQNLLTGRYTQVSFNRADVLVDGSAVYLVITVSNLFDRVTFDNTECGIGRERVQQG